MMTSYFRSCFLLNSRPSPWKKCHLRRFLPTCWLSWSVQFDATDSGQTVGRQSVKEKEGSPLQRGGKRTDERHVVVVLVRIFRFRQHAFARVVRADERNCLHRLTEA